MNWYLLVCASLCVIAFVLHITIGLAEFIKPIMESDVEYLVKKTLFWTFHCITVFLLCSTAVYTILASNYFMPEESRLLLGYLALVFGICAIVILIIIVRAKFEKPLNTHFQWLIFATISVLSILGSLQ